MRNRIANFIVTDKQESSQEQLKYVSKLSLRIALILLLLGIRTHIIVLSLKYECYFYLINECANIDFLLRSHLGGGALTYSQILSPFEY